MPAVVGCGRPIVIAPEADRAGAAEVARPREIERLPPGDGAEFKADPDAPMFRFPDDAGGAILTKLLPPTELRGPLNEPNPGPRRLLPPPGLESPAHPLPPTQAPLPRMAGERNRAPLRPRLIAEETLAGLRDPVPPHSQSFYSGVRTRIDSPDPSRPPPLPPLGQPVPDRASLDDATGDASAAAAVAAPTAGRVGPAPYQKVSLPDPFEFHRPTAVTPPPEDATPKTGSIQPPKS
jgi:hypothetical protein